MLCWWRRRRPRTTPAAARWTISSLCNNDPLIPHRAALPKSSFDVTSACTSVLRALTVRDDRIRLMDRSCAYAVRHVRLTYAAIDIVESSCTPRSRMLLDAMMLHPHTSIQRGGGCGMRLFGAANNMASVFVSLKSRQRDASHALTSTTQWRIRSTADAESPRRKSTYNGVSSAYMWYRISCFMKTSDRPAQYTEKRRGPNMLPWGTPCCSRISQDSDHQRWHTVFGRWGRTTSSEARHLARRFEIY